jgi:hypothetical protein
MTMKTYASILIALVAGLSLNCSREYELERSIFIADSVYTDLPAYTEWGYNTFGAFFDREIFVSNNAQIPAKVTCTDGNTSFILNGQRGSGYSYYGGYGGYYYGDGTLSTTFLLEGVQYGNVSDLVTWNDTLIDLTSPDCKVFITEDTTRTEVEILNGSLHIKRAQYLLVDDKMVEVILSGRFSFQMLYNGEPVSMSDGRFDVGIDENNFFIY